MAQWLYLRLQSFGPRSNSQTQHLRDHSKFWILFVVCCVKDENKQKEAGFGPYLKKLYGQDQSWRPPRSRPKIEIGIFFFIPISISKVGINRGQNLDSPRLFWQISSKSRDKSRPNLDSPRLLAKSRGESRLASTFLELPRKFWKSGKGLPIFWQIGIGEASPIFWQIGIEIGEASPIDLAHAWYWSKLVHCILRGPSELALSSEKDNNRWDP